MAPVSTFRAYGYTRDAELDEIAQLINTCRAADNLENRTSATRLQENFADPEFDITCDLRLWRNSTGDLVAAAALWQLMPEQMVLGRLEFEIHPQVCKDGLVDDVLTWAEQRLRETGQDKTLPVVLHSACRDSLPGRQSLLTQSGFTPERYFFRLQRSLHPPIPFPQIPDGWRIRSVDSQKDARAWVDMFNQTFVDHWNHHPMTVEAFYYYETLSTYTPTLNRVVETPDGQLVTFCVSQIDPERNARLGLKEGHVCLLGTRRGYRRLGLARSLLLESLQQLKAAGMETATIGVDAQNPLGALGLYESIGFQKVRSSTVFRKTVAR